MLSKGQSFMYYANNALRFTIAMQCNKNHLKKQCHTHSPLNYLNNRMITLAYNIMDICHILTWLLLTFLLCLLVFFLWHIDPIKLLTIPHYDSPLSFNVILMWLGHFVLSLSLQLRIYLLVQTHWHCLETWYSLYIQQNK